MATVAEFRMWLDALRRHDPSGRLFGAGKHRYEMNPCIGIEELERTEAALGTRLPEEYREFLLTCGNGGAGPGYGILSLAESIGEFGGDPLGIVGNDFVPPFAHFGCRQMWVLVTGGLERGSIWFYGAPVEIAVGRPGGAFDAGHVNSSGACWRSARRPH